MMTRLCKRSLRLGTWVAVLLGGLVTAAYPAIVTVSNTNDSGVGSLRDQVAAAASGDTIIFNLPPTTITLSSPITINKNLTILGLGANYLNISGNNATRVFAVTAGTVTIADLNITGGRSATASDMGAGILISGTANLTLDRCIVSSCALTGTGSVYGGGVFVTNTSTLTVRRSTFSNNSVPTTAGSGGAIYSAGTLVVTDSTFFGNSSRLGAAVYAYMGLGKTATLINCTVSGNTTDNQGSVLLDGTNTAVGGGSGVSSGSLSLTNCTITNNTASNNYEAGLSAANGGTLTLRNTIVAANNAPMGGGDTDIFFDTPGGYGAIVTFSSAGYNLIGSEGSQTYTWTTGDIRGTEASKQNPNLAALANNGGYVLTHLPNAGSQVVDPASSNSAVFVDGRGYSRVNTADKGACERSGVPPTALSATSITGTGFTANWNSITNASAYLLDIATNATFTNMVTGYWGLDVGNVTNHAVTGLSGSTTYYYRVRGYNTSHHTYYTGNISATTLLLTATPTITHTSTATMTPTLTMTGTPTNTRTPTATPTATFTRTSTASATATSTQTTTFTPTVSATLTASVTVSHTPTQTRTSTVSATATSTTTITFTPTATPTATVSATFTRTATLTATRTHTSTPSVTSTLTRTQTATVSPTPSVSPTGTVTATVSPTLTITLTGTNTPVVSATPTSTGTPAETPTLTVTSTAEVPVVDVTAYPNPAREIMHFVVKQDEAGPLEIHIYTVNGERAAVLKADGSVGVNILEWQCRSAAPGIYIARIHKRNETKKVKVAVVH